MAAAISVLLLFVLLQFSVDPLGAVGQTVRGSHDVDVLLTPPLLRHELPQECPLPAMDGSQVITAKQYKPGMTITDVPSISAPPLIFNFTSKNYIVQTCYNVGYVKSPVRHDITLVTFGSVDRLYNVIRTSQTWTGMISIAIYIKDPMEVTTYVDPLILNNPSVAERVTIHLLFENGEPAFPVNALRNLATVGVTTTHFLNCDLDFVPAYRSYENAITHQDLFEEQLLGNVRRLYVVPAVEMLRNIGKEAGDHFENKYLTMDVVNVKKYISKGILENFSGRAKGWGYHQPSDLDNWINATEPYDIPTARLAHRGIPDLYEPYCVMPTRLYLKSPTTGAEKMYSFLLWDELFTEYGSNKVVFLKMLRYMFGYKFTVLPNTLLFHMRHPPSSAANNFYHNVQIKEQMFATYRGRLRFWWETTQRALNATNTGLTKIIERFKQDQYLPLEYMDAMNKNITGDARRYKSSPAMLNVDSIQKLGWRKPELAPQLKKSLHVETKDVGALSFDTPQSKVDSPDDALDQQQTRGELANNAVAPMPQDNPAAEDPVIQNDVDQDPDGEIDDELSEDEEDYYGDDAEDAEELDVEQLNEDVSLVPENVHRGGMENFEVKSVLEPHVPATLITDESMDKMLDDELKMFLEAEKRLQESAAAEAALKQAVAAMTGNNPAISNDKVASPDAAADQIVLGKPVPVKRKARKQKRRRKRRTIRPSEQYTAGTGEFNPASGAEQTSAEQIGPFAPQLRPIDQPQNVLLTTAPPAKSEPFIFKPPTGRHAERVVPRQALQRMKLTNGLPTEEDILAGCGSNSFILGTLSFVLLPILLFVNISIWLRHQHRTRARRVGLASLALAVVVSWHLMGSESC